MAVADEDLWRFALRGCHRVDLWLLSCAKMNGSVLRFSTRRPTMRAGTRKRGGAAFSEEKFDTGVRACGGHHACAGGCDRVAGEGTRRAEAADGYHGRGDQHSLARPT